MTKLMMKVEQQLLSTVRQFLLEFKSEHAQDHVDIDASIERDLGLDSLSRVELFLRLEKAFAIRLKDQVMLEAETLKDILFALEQETLPLNLTSELVLPLHDTKASPLFSKTLVEVLQKRAILEPNRPHIYLQTEDNQEQIIRYGELWEKANQVAAGLYEAGIRPEDTIAIMLPTCGEFFYAFFGILILGAIPVPIYPPLRADKIEEYSIREANILNNAEVKLLITFGKTELLSKLLQVFIKSLNSVKTVEQLLTLGNKKSFPKPVINENDPALIQYTSGSTSTPKGVLLTHFNLLSNVQSFGNAIQLSPRDVVISWLPLYHDMGLIGAWLGSLCHASPLTILSPLSFLNRPERWLWAIHYHQGTISGGPNFAYELCVRKIDGSLIQGLDLSSWRLAFNGAEAVDPKTLERFSAKFSAYGFKPETHYPVYGLAESSVALCFPPLHRGPIVDHIQRESFEKEQRAESSLTSDTQALQFVSCGKPLPNHDIRIVDDQGQVLPEKQIGNIQFTGPSAMQGYFRNIEATKAVYFDGWWATGDLGYIREGEVYITGRKKDVIIKAGRNLYPQEIESVTSEVPNVRKGCVIAFGINDPKQGTEKLVVIAETSQLKKSIHQETINKIFEKIRITLDLSPDEIIMVPPRTLPKTSSGKLQRALCKELYLSRKLSRKALPFSLQIIKLFLKGTAIKLRQYLELIILFCYTVYLDFLILTCLPFSIILFILPKNTTRILIKKIASIFLKLSLNAVKVYGRENLQNDAPTIFTANHASYIDALILLSILPIDVKFVGKEEILQWPLIGRIFKKLEFYTVNRDELVKSLDDSKRLNEALQEKSSIAIFPEGTFTYSPGLRPFKLGAFKLSADNKIPICAIAIQGTRPLFRTDKFIQRPGRITIYANAPIAPQNAEWNEIHSLQSKVRHFISSKIDEKNLGLSSFTVKVDNESETIPTIMDLDEK